jgi:archaellum biogenesis ATPase FlaH
MVVSSNVEIFSMVDKRNSHFVRLSFLPTWTEVKKGIRQLGERMSLINEVRNYIAQKGWRVLGETNSDGETWIRIERCVFCQDTRGHFYICGETGQYKCHAGNCGVSGSFFTLKKHMGDLMEPTTFSDFLQETPKPKFGEQEIAAVHANHLRLLQDKETLLYLSSRHFSREAVQYFQLGLEIVDGIKWLSFPYFDLDGLKNVKYRTLPPAKKAFRRLEGGESTLYNERILHADYDELLLTEGETDCIALWSHGVKNVVGVSIGAGSFKPEWVKLLDKYKRLYICYDNDEAGLAGAQKFANRMGLSRCRQVRLPPDVKDINEFFVKGHTIQEFHILLQQADKFDVENVTSLGGAIREQLRNAYLGVTEVKYELPWKNVNKLLNGLVPGDLIVLGGKPGVGKSTLALNILYHFASYKKMPVLLISLEMPIWRILPRIVALHKGIDSQLCNSMDVLAQAYQELKDVPFYFAYKYNKPTWNFIADTIRASVKYYGIQCVAFDNLHFMIRSLNRQTEETSVMIQNFALLAKELSIPIIVIARPRKTGAKIIDGEDLKNSADISGDADIILIIHRERKKSMNGEEVEGNFEPKTLIVADKVRYSKGGSTFLIAHDDIARFEELGG